MMKIIMSLKRKIMSLKIMMNISMKYDDAGVVVVVDDDDDDDGGGGDDDDDDDDDIMIFSGENESTVHRDAAWVIRKLWTQYRLGSVDEVCI